MLSKAISATVLKLPLKIICLLKDLPSNSIFNYSASIILTHSIRPFLRSMTGF